MEKVVAATLRRLEAKDRGLKRLLNKAHAYVVFPSVGKAAVVIGGAYGRGAVYERGKFVGYATLGQTTIGVQLGGDTFSEVIVFDSPEPFERFKKGRLAFAANASAVLVKAGAAASARYEKGVAVFVYASGGMLLELGIGGQKFKFKPKDQADQEESGGAQREEEDEGQEGEQGDDSDEGEEEGATGAIGKTLGFVKRHKIAATLVGIGVGAWLGTKAVHFLREAADWDMDEILGKFQRGGDEGSEGQSDDQEDEDDEQQDERDDDDDDRAQSRRGQDYDEGEQGEDEDQGEGDKEEPDAEDRDDDRAEASDEEGDEGAEEQGDEGDEEGQESDEEEPEEEDEKLHARRREPDRERRRRGRGSDEQRPRGRRDDREEQDDQDDDEEARDQQDEGDEEEDEPEDEEQEPRSSRRGEQRGRRRDEQEDEQESEPPRRERHGGSARNGAHARPQHQRDRAAKQRS